MSHLSQFNYQILGEKANPKLIFLHGLMGFGSNWKSIARHFESTHEILLYDQRGHGRSHQPPQGYKVADYASDLALIMDELGWASAVIVGHSMGGRVAAEFAAKHPERVEKLVIVDIGPESDQASAQSIEDKIRFVSVPFQNRDAARAFFDGPFLEKFRNETVKNFFYANLEDDESGQMNWRFFLPGILETLAQSRQGDQWPQFKKLAMPVLLVRGEKSVDLPAALFDKVLASNSHIQGQTVAGAGHWVHVEKPKELLQILKEFI